jgi:hypothetical protein
LYRIRRLAGQAQPHSGPIYHATIATTREGWGAVPANARGIDVPDFGGNFDWATISASDACRAWQYLSQEPLDKLRIGGTW